MDIKKNASQVRNKNKSEKQNSKGENSLMTPYVKIVSVENDPIHRESQKERIQMLK